MLCKLSVFLTWPKASDLLFLVVAASVAAVLVLLLAIKHSCLQPPAPSCGQPSSLLTLPSCCLLLLTFQLRQLALTASSAADYKRRVQPET
jgi:hypothetical protein